MLILIVLLFSFNKEVESFKIDGLEGAIFHNASTEYFHPDKERWSPSIKEIEKAIKITNEYLNENKAISKQGTKSCPSIYRKRKNYFYQVFGFVNDDRENLIFINAIWKDSFSKEDLKGEVIFVLDGCSHYWQIEVNLEKEKVEAFTINGEA